MHCLISLPLLLLTFALPPSHGDLIEGRKPYYILEELPANTRIGNIAIDAGLTEKYDEAQQRELSFQFLQPGPTIDPKFDLFSIDNRSSIIKTSQRIDRDKVCANEITCYVRFDVAVGPSKYFEIIKIIVDILDINDHSPAFDEPSVFLKMSESVQSGTKFSLPTAVDPDSEAYSIQSYELIAHTSKFNLVTEKRPDGSTDLQLVVTDLDREEANFYQFQVMAYDGGIPQKSGSILVNIEVEDSNDNDPKFDNATYEVFVLENVDPGTAIARVQAHDLDAGTNGEVTYTFSARTVARFGDLFGIYNTTGTIFLKQALDFEQGSTYHLVVYANDHGPNSKPAHASVVVRVEDSNDNPPEIMVNLPPNGIAYVAESAVLGTFVAVVSVMDQDGGDNGKVDCSLKQSSFELQEMSENQFKIVTAAKLDKEHEPQYKLKVECFDLGFRPRTSTAEILVRVLDDNDHAPQFVKQVYHAFITENNYLNQEIIRMNASDVDHDVNGVVMYRLEPKDEKVVSINPLTGVVEASAVFDREELEEYSFIVVAYDQGAPPLSSSATVVLTITDQNDEAPKFTQTNYAFGTFENQPINTEVGRVVANDRDTSPNAQFRYYMGSSEVSASKSFRIHPTTGTIYTSRILDRETQPVYYMTLEARSDADYPPMSGTASVTIYVADKNDNSPIIHWPNLRNNTVYVSSLVQAGYEVAQIDATDKDIGSNGKLQYHITGGNFQNRFDVNPALGTVVTVQDVSDIFYEVFTLSLTVQDDGYPKLATSTFINIVVNQSIPYTPAKKIVYTNNNVTIIISLTSASLILVFLLVIAILLVRRQTTDRKESKVTEAQTMLHRDQLQRASQQQQQHDWASLHQKDSNTVQVSIPPDPPSSSTSQNSLQAQTPTTPPSYVIRDNQRDIEGRAQHRSEPPGSTVRFSVNNTQV